MPTSGSMYLDANIIIQIVEGHPVHRLALDRFISAIDNGAVAVLTSELTLAEVLVAPLRDNDRQRIAAFESMLAPGSRIAMAPRNRSVLTASAQLRAASGCRLPDAIHAATAELAGATWFLIEDRRIALPAKLTRIDLAHISHWLSGGGNPT